MAHSMLNVRKNSCFDDYSAATDYKSTFRTKCCILVVNCVYCNEMQPLYIIFKNSSFLFI